MRSCIWFVTQVSRVVTFHLAGGVAALLSMAILAPIDAQALQGALSWQASPSQGVVGYKVQVGQAHGDYTTSIDVGNSLSYQLQGMTYNNTYFIAVKAYSVEGESVSSNEIQLRADAQVPFISAVGLNTEINGQPIAAYSNITSGATIDLAQIPGKSFSFAVSVSNSTKSVRFAQPGEVGVVVDSVAAYQYAWSTDSSVNKWVPSPGSYILHIQAYSELNATGSSGELLSINFRVVDTTPTSSTVDETPTNPPVVGSTSNPPVVDSTSNPPVVDSTSSNTGNSSQIDTDKDGLTDAQEATLGTNANVVDTDNDSVSDGQEVLDKSNPLDRGSYILPLLTTVCADWNGFLDRMFNVMEHVNNTSQTLRVRSVLYNSSGKQMRRISFTIAPGSQYDLLVHDMAGWQVNNVGKVCSSYNGNPGDLDGRMAYYKVENDQSSARSYQFAFAMPFANSIKGKQYVSFNTFQPSLAAVDQSNVVANWIQLTNRSNQKERGVMTFYDQQGKIIAKRDLSLPSGARVDVPAHVYGASIVGLVEWSPANGQAGFEMRNVRYIYDNPEMKNSFAAAFQLDAAPGTYAKLSVPLSSNSQTAVLELANVSAEYNEVVVGIFGEDGSLKREVKMRIAPYSTYHLIADEILRKEDGTGSDGLAILQSINKRALIATTMHYARKVDGSIAYMYGIDARESLGTVLSGSYNTFLSQKSLLVVTNPTATAQTFSFNLTRSGSKSSLLSVESQWSVPARGSITIDLNVYLTGDQYGVVQVLPENFGNLTAWVLRKNVDNYVMTTILRSVGAV